MIDPHSNTGFTVAATDESGAPPLRPQSHVRSLTPAKARAIAKEAYIYGFPLVDSYRIQYSYFVDRDHPEYKGAWNRVHHIARVYTPDDKAIQTPNSDTPYSHLGADLRTEPLVLTVPEVENGRYYALQFIDLYTFNFAYAGSRTTGNGAASFLLAGPHWTGEKPEGIHSVIRAETDFAFVFYRTQLFDPADIENVKAVQAGYQVQTLSQYLGKPTPPALPDVGFVKPLTREQERTSLDFFNVMNFVLRFCPPHASEEALLARFAELGIGAAQPFDAQVLDPDVRRAMEDGIADAWRDYDALEKQMATGERTSGDVFGNRTYLQNHYLYRMLAAVDGIYGNSKEEAIYPGYLIDSDGQRLNGAEQRYTLRFAPGQLPPVNAFWSLTLYEAPSRFLFPNPLKRYLINSPMLPALQRDPDGGVTIYVQHASPGEDKESNWLPAPAGPFIMALRLFWPKPAALDCSWKAPALHKAH
jgi:hypothetical protein